MNISQLAAAGALNLGPLGLAITYFIVFVDSFLVPLIFALAFISFLYGVYTYFFSVSADTEKRNKGKAYVLYGIIGFVLMVSVWGIVNIFTNTLGFSGYTRPALPLFGNSGASTNSTAADSVIKYNGTTNGVSDCLAGEHWDANAPRNAYGDKGVCVKN